MGQRLVKQTLFPYLVTMIPVALFIRVSSKTQNYDRQVNDLRPVAERQGWTIVQIVSEVGSATKRKNVQRPVLEELLQLCRLKRITKVLVTEFSRLGRRRAETPVLMESITELGVSVYAHNVSLETLLPSGQRNPVAGIIMAVMFEIDAMEVERNSERIRSGQALAKQNGTHIGRPSGTTKNSQQILDAYPGVVRDLKAGLSIRQSAASRALSKGTVERVKAALGLMNTV